MVLVTYLQSLLPWFIISVGSSSSSGGSTTFYEAITAALTQLLTWLGTILGSLLSGGDLSTLLPLFAITVAISLIMLAVRVARTFAWGA